MSVPLAQRKCVPCAEGSSPLAADAIGKLQAELGGDWEVVDEHHLSKTFTFPNFVEALAFVNQVGEVAEEQNHHPDIFLTWGKVRVEIWTHTVKGLSEADFVLAAKIDHIA